MATKTPPINEALWHPLTLARMKHLKAGRAIPGLRFNKPIQTSHTPSKKVIDQITKFYQTGDVAILSDMLKANPFLLNFPPLNHQLWWLKVLCDCIEDNFDASPMNPDFHTPPTHEFLWITGREFRLKAPWNSFPVGTQGAAQQALVELVQAWVQGFLPGYSVQKTPGMTKVTKTSQRRGPKEKRTSWEIYGDWGARLFIFYDMLEYLKEPPNGHCKKEDFKGDSSKEPAAFEARTIKLVQRIHQEFGLWSKYRKGGGLGAPVKILPLPKPIAQTIAQQAIQKKTVNKKNLLYGLFAEYERNDPTQYRAIGQLIYREEAVFPELIPTQFRPSRSKKSQ